MPQEEKYTKDELEDILDRALEKQRKEMFGYLGDVTGYNLGDFDQVQRLQRAFSKLKSYDERSEEFKDVGRKIFMTFMWTSVIGGTIWGAYEYILDKIRGLH